MTLFCSIAGHSAQTTHRRNQGLDFSICHHCGCDLIRAAHGDWKPVPRGMRVVWHAAPRFSDGASVRARFDAMGRPPRRRTPRDLQVPPYLQRPGRPLEGTKMVIGILANLGRLANAHVPKDVQRAAAPSKTIRLPGALH